MESYAQRLWTQIVDNVTSPLWLADNLLTWVIFTVLVTLVVSAVQSRRERRRRAPYEGWKLRIVGYSDEDEPLYHQDVERFRTSKFELWKFAKWSSPEPCG